LFCRCLHYFSSNEINDWAIKLPNKNKKWLRFNNYSRKEIVEGTSSVCRADLECILEKTNSDPRASQHRRVFSLAYYVHYSYDKSLCYYRFHPSKDCVAWFVEELRNLAHRVKSILFANIPMETLSSEQWEAFCNATQCYVWDKPFTSDDTRVRDHCHLTGPYRGPVHSNCNLNYKDSHCIPTLFHNLSGYDAHFIIKEIATAYERQVELFPIMKEKYISFTKIFKAP